MDQPEHTDVVVIGLGPADEYAAGTLAEAGLHVTGIESRILAASKGIVITFHRAIEDALAKPSGIGPS